MPAGIALALSQAAASRPDGRLPRLSRPAASLHVLGLPAGALVSRRGAAHRPPAAVAASRRPARRLHDRQDAARQGQGLRPHADLVRTALTWRPLSRETAGG